VANTPDSSLPEDPAIDSLEDRIAAARAAEDERLAKETPAVVGTGGGATQVISTMIGYPLGGIVIGFGLDNLFNTLPWITIVLMFLAFAGACIHVVRTNSNRTQ
jgi:ATP synthase protein I